MISSVEILERIIRSDIQKINTLYLARVEKVYNDVGKADIQPLEKKIDSLGNEIEPPLVQGVPILTFKSKDFYIKIPYQKDDIVIVACTKHSIDNFLVDKKVMADELRFQRRFNLNDSVIIGGLLSESDGSIDGNNDLEIVNKSKGTRIALKEDGSVEIDADLHVTGDIISDGTITGKVEVVGGLTNVRLTQHGHPVQVDPNSGVGSTVPPVTP